MRTALRLTLTRPRAVAATLTIRNVPVAGTLLPALSPPGPGPQGGAALKV